MANKKEPPQQKKLLDDLSSSPDAESPNPPPASLPAKSVRPDTSPKQDAAANRKARDAARLTRQLKIDFDSQEDMEQFKAWADEIGVSYSQLARFCILTAQRESELGRLDVQNYLIESKLPWIRPFDIDFEKLTD